MWEGEMDIHASESVFDYVVIGSGFGGSVSAMRLTEKGYSVLVLERGGPAPGFCHHELESLEILRSSPLRWHLTDQPVKKCHVLHGCGAGGAAWAMPTC
jgi:choline dehydrogenase-like flavoprotein